MVKTKSNPSLLDLAGTWVWQQENKLLLTDMQWFFSKSPKVPENNILVHSLCNNMEQVVATLIIPIFITSDTAYSEALNHTRAAYFQYMLSICDTTLSQLLLCSVLICAADYQHFITRGRQGAFFWYTFIALAWGIPLKNIYRLD